MKTRRFHQARGTALLLALLVLLAATFVLAGWAMLLAQRIAFSEEFVTAQKRRLAGLNAENLGKQWARSAISSNAVPPVSITLSNNWGRFTAATSASNIMSIALVDSRLNHFGPMAVGGYTLPISTTLSGDGFTNARVYFLRSRSPVLGGFPLVAQTNTITGSATDFSEVAVATNSPALVYAAPGSTATAPAAVTYLAATNRNVVTPPGSTTQAPPSPYPFLPLVSAPSGTNAFDGLLTPSLSRTFTINNLDAAIDAAFPTTPTVSNPLRSPNGSTGTFRIIGSVPGDRQIFEPSFSRAPSMLLVGPVPDAPPNQVNAQRIQFFYFGQTFDFRFTDSGLQYQKGGSWVPSPRINPTTTYVRMRQSDGDIDHVTITDPIIMSDVGGGGEDRAILFAPLDGSLVAIRANEISFSTLPGPFATAVPAAVAYRSATFAESAILLLGTPTATTGYYAQTAMNPQNFQLRALVDGVPLLQLDHTVPHDFRDPSGDPVLAYAGAQAERVVLRARAGTASPVLANIRQDTLAGNQWRKVLLVFSTQNTLSTETSNSALVFSYLEQGELGIALEDADNSRQFALSVRGGPGVADQATRIVGGNARTWNLTATFNNSPAEFQPGGNLTLVGGIRSNVDVTVTPSTSSLTLERNTAPGDLDLFVDRMGWIESWNQ